jgi:hypothetical protein
MLIIIDKKLSAQAKKTLSSYMELMELETENITYPSISGHPDIFFCQAPGHLFVAPNLPEKYFDQLKRHGIDYFTGELPVGPEYPASARYNAVATEKYLIHNFRHTDPAIIRTLQHLEKVNIDQGYCRCNLLPLKNDHFITSDQGIYKVSGSRFQVPGSRFQVPGSRFQVPGSEEQEHPHSTFNIQPSTFLYVSPETILLEGFPHGFFGGCCGVWEDKIFINGSLDLFEDGDKVKVFLHKIGYQIVELTDGPLTDVGSIMFIAHG